MAKPTDRVERANLVDAVRSSKDSFSIEERFSTTTKGEGSKTPLRNEIGIKNQRGEKLVHRAYWEPAGYVRKSQDWVRMLRGEGLFKKRPGEKRR